MRAMQYANTYSKISHDDSFNNPMVGFTVREVNISEAYKEN